LAALVPDKQVLPDPIDELLRTVSPAPPVAPVHTESEGVPMDAMSLPVTPADVMESEFGPDETAQERDDVREELVPELPPSDIDALIQQAVESREREPGDSGFPESSHGGEPTNPTPEFTSADPAEEPEEEVDQPVPTADDFFIRPGTARRGRS